jgi:hypothetical protein
MGFLQKLLIDHIEACDSLGVSAEVRELGNLQRGRGRRPTQERFVPESTILCSCQ